MRTSTLMGVGAVVALVSLIPAQGLAETYPMNVSIYECSGVTRGCTSEPPASEADHCGNSPDQRGLHVELLYHYNGEEWERLAAADLVDRIELCWFEPVTDSRVLVAHCPPPESLTDEWIVYDRAATEELDGSIDVTPGREVIPADPVTGVPARHNVLKCARSEQIPSLGDLTQNQAVGMFTCDSNVEGHVFAVKQTYVIDGVLDWMDTTGTLTQRGLFIRVFPRGAARTDGDLLTYSEIKELAAIHGTCTYPSIRALAPTGTDPYAHIVSADPSFQPFGADLNMSLGIRILEPARPYPQLLGLFSDAQAQYLWELERNVFVGQYDRMQGGLPYTDRRVAWRNSPAGADILPSHVMTARNTSDCEGWFTAFVNRNAVYGIDPACDGSGQPCDGAAYFCDPESPRHFTRPVGHQTAGFTDMPVHETFHMFQEAWGRNGTAAHGMIFGGQWFTDSLAHSVESTACIQIPNDPGTLCGSSGKFRDYAKPNCRNNVPADIKAYPATHIGYFYEGKQILANPSADTITTPYYSGIFWKYIFEQFAYPLSQNSLAHPGGVDSTIQREPLADQMSLRARIYSDQGQDFIGQLYKQIVDSPVQTSVLRATNAALRNNLGRSFPDVLFDFHTAFYLKDYTDTDPRWRFDWAHGDGFNADTTTASLKPLAVPPDLNGLTADGFYRVRRTLDSWQPCVGTSCPTPVPFPSGSTASGVGTRLGSFGTTAMSVRPDPTTDSAIQVTVSALRGDPTRFRVFRIDRENSTNLVPYPVCGSSPAYECLLSSAADHPEGRLSLPVPINPATEELLLIASTAGDPGLFDWSIGPLQPTLSILSPTTSRQASIGNRLAPRTFMVSLLARDAAWEPLDVQPSQLTVTVPNCANSSVSCVVPNDAEHLVFTGLGNGASLLAITLPPEFYSSDISLPLYYDLSIQVQGVSQPAVSPQSLVATANDGGQATVLVLDKSNSMGMGEDKLSAMKIAAKALIQSLPESGGSSLRNRLAIVAFNHDAETVSHLSYVVPGNVQAFCDDVDGITSSGSTSVGDGVFEAQSILANALDDATTRPARQVIIVMSDGASSDLEDRLFAYYQTDPPVNPADVPTGDGNGGSWGGRALTWAQRSESGLPLPTSIEAVGFRQIPAQDVGWGDLSALTSLTGNRVIVADTDALLGGALAYGADPEMETYRLARSMIDAMSSRLTNSSGSTRIVAGELDSTELSMPEAWPITGIGNSAQELRVLVMGAGVGDADLALEGPQGIIEPVSVLPDSVTFHELAPTGDFGLRSNVPSSQSKPWFVEITARSAIELVTQIGPPRQWRYEHGLAGDDAIAGTEIPMLLVPIDGQPVVGCQASAEVVNPEGQWRTVSLVDDGHHGDGTADDGVYAGLFAATGIAGGYRAYLSVTCDSPPSGVPFRRERLEGFVVTNQDDSDLDGLPDGWEQTYGSSMDDPADASFDPDSDDLSNLEEFNNGTSPLVSDTDGGGESDRSELDQNRDPRDPDDDAIAQPLGIPNVGNRMVHIPVGMGLDGAQFVVERGPTADGPFIRLYDTVAPGTLYAVDQPIENGTSYCYRVRVESASAVSGWSVPRCVTPSIDPYPPEVVVGMPYRTCRGSEIAVPISPSDQDPASEHGQSAPFDSGTVASGVVAVRYWAGSGEPPDGLEWRAVTYPLLVNDLDPAAAKLSIQVRDYVGNVSPIHRIDVPPPVVCVTADAGEDQVVECTNQGAEVELDATASEGVTAEPLDFLWSAEGVTFDEPTSATPMGWFPLGTTTATVVVSNSGGSDEDSVEIDVIDTTPPTLTVPPDVTLTNCQSTNIGQATATDTCGSVVVTGDKPTRFGAGTTVVTYTATDASGNTATGIQKVTMVLGDDPACCPVGYTVRVGTSNNDVLNGTSGNDCIIGLGAQDTINGAGGNDVISGGEGDDTIDGGAGNDSVWGGNGQDVINGGVGTDYLDGGGGDDTCRGGDQNDTLRGGQGQDKLYGDGGNDQLYGDDGDDRLEGGYGDDMLNGGGLHDTCLGGPGTDTFFVCESVQQ